MVNVVVRRATRDDLEALQTLKRVSSTILLTKLGHSLEQISAWQDRFCTEDYFKRYLKAPNTLFVVEEGDENERVVKGMASLTLKTDGEESAAYFANMYCLDSDKGYGSRLMVHRLGVLENFNLDYAYCHVHSKNEKAQRFVEHYGFVKEGSYKDLLLGSTQLIYRLR